MYSALYSNTVLMLHMYVCPKCGYVYNIQRYRSGFARPRKCSKGQVDYKWHGNNWNSIRSTPYIKNSII